MEMPLWILIRRLPLPSARRRRAGGSQLHGQVGFHPGLDRLDGAPFGEHGPHAVEGPRVPLPLQGHAGLGPDVLRQVGHHPAHPQHDGEGAQVPEVPHRQREPRRHEEEVQGRDAQPRGQQGRPAAEPRRHDGDAQHVEHDDVGEVQVVVHHETGGGGEHQGKAHGPQPPEPGRFEGLERSGFRCLVQARGDHPDLDVPASMDQVLQERAREAVQPPRAAGAGQEDGRDLPGPGQRQEVRRRPQARGLDLDHLGAQPFGQPEMIRQPFLCGLGIPEALGRFAVDSQPGDSGRAGEGADRPEKAGARGPAVDGHHPERRPTASRGFQPYARQSWRKSVPGHVHDIDSVRLSIAE